ncbi:MAG: alpha-amylase family glycosyl hydrolase [Flavobacterium sp.]
MKKIYIKNSSFVSFLSSQISFLLILIVGLSLSVKAQTVSVTFQVDMSGLTISPAGVHIAGDFQQAAGFPSNWNPASTQLQDPDNDHIYSIQVNIPSGNYSYKFINGNQWPQAENPPALCSVTNNNNRTVQVNNSDLILPAVPFNGCYPSVRFSVDLNDIPVSPNGIFVTGNFQMAAGFSSNWNPTQHQLFDYDNDGLYETTLNLPAGTYQYQYLNGGDLNAPEPTLNSCMSNEGFRSFTIENGQNLALMNCFGTCEVCLPSDTATGISGWWNDVVFYEVFVRSFYDHEGNDGIGDFRGLIEKLDYLNDGDPNTDTDLGIGAIWLMPMMASPSYHGYDVTDYYATEPDYGSMEDFEALLDACHARGVKVIIDHVMNHSSSQHPWFQQSIANQNNKRDWYIWSNTNPNFVGPWGQNVWHSNSSGFYYGLFWGGMPDLNYQNQALKNEMIAASEFWLNKGVDGFRLDAIKYLIEEGALLENRPETFSLLEEFNESFKAVSEDFFSIGEVWSNTSSVIPYVTGNKLDACFDFDLATQILNGVNTRNATPITNQIETVVDAYPGQRYGTFLTNHDINRVMDFFQNDVEKMKSAAAIYLTLPGIPFIYYGEEIGMSGSGIDEEKRKPMQWNTTAHAGFSTANPWRNVGSNYVTNNVSTQAAQPNSLLNHYKRLIKLRNENLPLQRGKYVSVSSTSSQCLMYARSYGQEVIMIVHNLGTTDNTPTLGLNLSSLPEGTYFVNDLYSQTNVGQITINSAGGFENWQATSPISAGKTWVLSFDEQALSLNLNDSFAAPPYLYPNPTNGLLQISGLNLPLNETIHIEIIDALGRKHLANQLNDEKTIDVSFLSTGLYWIRLSSENSSFVLSFLRE